MRHWFSHLFVCLLSGIEELSFKLLNKLKNMRNPNCDAHLLCPKMYSMYDDFPRDAHEFPLSILAALASD